MVQIKKIIQDGSVDERRYLWMARAFSILAVASICANLALGFVILKMLSFNAVEPFFVDMNNKIDQEIYVTKVSDQLLQGNKSRTDVATQLGERFIRQYIVARESFPDDSVQREKNWNDASFLKSYSSDSVYNEFRSSDFFKKTVRSMDKRRRVVVIKSVEWVTKDNWRVEGLTRDIIEGENVTRTPVDFKLDIAVDFEKNTSLDYEEKKKNPLGLKVIKYLHKLGEPKYD